MKDSMFQLKGESNSRKNDNSSRSGLASEEETLRVNPTFARKFDRLSKKEELKKLKALEEELGSEESDSETEDEDGELLSSNLDSAISKTLHLIRSKDPSIYDKSKKFYDAEGNEVGANSTKKSKKDAPIYYKDLVRKQVLEGDVNDSDEEETSRGAIKTYQEEQEDIRGAFLNSLKSAEDEDDGGDLEGNLFRIREKSSADQAQEDAAFEEFRKKHPGAVKADEDAEAFLNRYVSSKGWIDHSKTPTYKDIVGDDDEQGFVSDEEDAMALEAAEEFEHQYNFRFEEDGGAQIQSYARSVEGSMRRVDNKRKTKRQDHRERKALERQKLEEELRRLKNLKRAEIQEKLDRITQMAGANAVKTKAKLVLKEEDIDADFDPEEHDRRMAELFNDDYYEDTGDDEENLKPTWDDDEDEELFGPGGLQDDENDEDDDDNDDEDDNDVSDTVENNETEVEGDDERTEFPSDVKGMTAEQIEAMKQKYLDELYKLDYEDVVAGMPTRFKYKKVQENDFGLSAEDIIDADDALLKKYVPLKKMSTYRTAEHKITRSKMKNFKKELKYLRKQQAKAGAKKESTPQDLEEDNNPVETSVSADSEQPKDDEHDKDAVKADTNSEESKPKRKRKRKHRRNKGETSGEADQEEDVKSKTKKRESSSKEDNEAESEPSSKKHRKRKNKEVTEKKSVDGPKSIPSSRLESYKLKPLK